MFLPIPRQIAQSRAARNDGRINLERVRSGITALLQIAVLRFTSWPLLPVGFVTSYGAFVANAWFSIFAGWLAKALIVRLGGASLYTRLMPLFLGVILGEALAAGALLAINAIAVMNGYESQTVKFLL